MAKRINNYLGEVDVTLREFLYPGQPQDFVASAKSIGKRLKAHVDEPVKSGDRTLVLRARLDTTGAATGTLRFHIEDKSK